MVVFLQNPVRLILNVIFSTKLANITIVVALLVESVLHHGRLDAHGVAQRMELCEADVADAELSDAVRDEQLHCAPCFEGFSAGGQERVEEDGIEIGIGGCCGG